MNARTPLRIATELANAGVDPLWIVFWAGVRRLARLDREREAAERHANESPVMGATPNPAHQEDDRGQSS